MQATMSENELRRRGMDVVRQVPIDVRYEDVSIDGGFRADLIVEGKVLVELKSVERTAPLHKKQTLTYVRLADLRLSAAELRRRAHEGGDHASRERSARRGSLIFAPLRLCAKQSKRSGGTRDRRRTPTAGPSPSKGFLVTP